MVDIGQGAAFLEEAFEAVTETVGDLGGRHLYLGAGSTQGEESGQVFLDGDGLLLGVAGDIDEAETAGAEDFADLVVLQLVADG